MMQLGFTSEEEKKHDKKSRNRRQMFHVVQRSNLQAILSLNTIFELLSILLFCIVRNEILLSFSGSQSIISLIWAFKVWLVIGMFYEEVFLFVYNSVKVIFV